MSKFTEWLVAKGYTTSEDKTDIEEQLSGVEADVLFQMFLDDGNYEWDVKGEEEGIK